MVWRTGNGTAGTLTPGGAWIVPCRRPVAKVHALIFEMMAGEALGGGSRRASLSILAFLASCMPTWMQTNENIVLADYIANYCTHIYVWHNIFSFFLDLQILVYPYNRHIGHSLLVVRSPGSHHTSPAFYYLLQEENTIYLCMHMSVVPFDIPALVTAT